MNEGLARAYVAHQSREPFEDVEVRHLTVCPRCNGFGHLNTGAMTIKGTKEEAEAFEWLEDMARHDGGQDGLRAKALIGLFAHGVGEGP